MAGKIQGADHKTLSELISAGATAADLMDDSKLYVTANGINKQLSQAIIDGDIGGGGGGKNYIKNGNANSSTTGWALYSDAAGSSPVDGTGGTATGLTFVRNTTTPLAGTGDFKLSKDAANRQGKGVSYDFTIDRSDEVKSFTIASSYRVSSLSTGENSDVQVFIYDIDNSALIVPDIKYLANGKSFLTTFNSTSSLNYRLILHIATTNASAWDLYFDEVSVGPGTIQMGAAMSDWKEYSLVVKGTVSDPTPGSPTVNKAMWRRVGDSMEISYILLPSTTGTAGSGNYLFPLPSGYLVDSNKIDLSSPQVGSAWIQAGSITGTGMVSLADSSHLAVFVDNASGSTFGNAQTPLSSSYYSFGSFITEVRFFAKVPIQGWTSEVLSTSSSSFHISNIIASGTRVTSTPAALGEYRTYTQDASAYTGSDNAPSQTSSSIAADGMKIYSVPWASAGTNGEPNRIEIYIGKNKQYKFEAFASSGRSGNFFTDFDSGYSTAVEVGLKKEYNPSTGVLMIDAIPVRATTANNYVGYQIPVNGGAYTTATDCYFDVIVNETNLPILSSPIRSEVMLSSGNGFGSSSTKIRRFSNTVTNIGSAIVYSDSATLGAIFEIKEEGIYSISYNDYGSTAVSFGISKNSSQLTTGVGSINDSDLMCAVITAAGDSRNVSITINCKVGDIIRPHTDGFGLTDGYYSVTRFTITKVSN